MAGIAAHRQIGRVLGRTDDRHGWPPVRHRMRWGVVALAVTVACAIGGQGAYAALSGGHTSARAATATPAAGLTGADGALAGNHQVPSVLSGLSLARYLSPAPASRVMTVGVSAQRPDAAAVTRLYDGIYNPASPLYHHYLTPAQFDQQFGLPAAQVSAVEHWLTSAGLTLDSAAGDGSYYTASGTVAELDRLFDVAIGTYSAQGKTFLANNVAPSVPKALPVDDVLGLDTVQKFSVSPLTGAVSNMASSAPGSTGPGPQAGTQQTLTAQDLWGVYDDPGAAALTISDPKAPSGTKSDPATLEKSKYDLGQGQTAGIFGEGETSSSIAQLRLFEAALGLPKVPVRTVYTEGTPGSAYGDNTPAIEWYLDSQAITGMAPDLSQLDFYFAKSLYDYDVFQDFSYWVNDPGGPRQMNASFGECEANPTDPVTNPLAEVPYGTEYGDQLQLAGEPMLKQAAVEGRTLFTSAGDTGSGCPEVVVPVAGAGNGLAVQPVPDVSYPCTSDYAVCVGGTVVSVNGASYPASSQRVAETSWTFGGGGSSFYQGEPPFQKGVANVDMPCLSTPQGDPYAPGSGPTCRGAPDVSAMSGNVTGDQYFIYIDGEPSGEGGTSLSSPLTVGQWARVQAGALASIQKPCPTADPTQQEKAADCGGLGFAAPLIYAQASSADACSSSPSASAAQSAACTSTPYAQDFTDVTQSEYGVGNGLYRPGPGWDYASGWGAFNVANFIADVDCAAQDTCATVPAGAAYSLGNWNHAKGDYSGTITATERYGGTEASAVEKTTAILSGPQGWSTDPIDVSAVSPGPGQAPGGPPVPIPGDNTTPNYDPSLDITGATLTANATTVTATISGPYLGATPPATAGAGGNSYFVAWEYNGTVYYARAIESALTQTWSFTSGNTDGGGYNDSTTTKATGSLSQSGDGDTITIEVPASEVGSPGPGALLSDPQAFSQLNTGTPVAFLQLTTDSADDLVPVSQLMQAGKSGDCQASARRTLGGYSDSSSWYVDRQGDQVLLCSVAESQGVAVEVQPPPTQASGALSSSPAPGTSIGPVSVPLSVPAGLSTPAAPLLPPLGVVGATAATPPSEAKLS